MVNIQAVPHYFGANKGFMSASNADNDSTAILDIRLLLF
jgi:hypothetical protein